MIMRDHCIWFTIFMFFIETYEMKAFYLVYFPPGNGDGDDTHAAHHLTFQF